MHYDLYDSSLWLCSSYSRWISHARETIYCVSDHCAMKQLYTILTAYRKVIAFMLLIAICLLIDVLAIVLFMRDALKPGTFLTMNCFQTGFFGGVCIMEIVAVSQGRSEAGLGFSIFVL
jgi:hypothetical protein